MRLRGSMEGRFERYHPDMEAMHRGFRTRPCFVCKLVDGDDELPQYVSYEDERAVAFLDGYTLVAPKEHREQVTADFTMEECIDLQRLVYRVTEAVRQEVGAERMYIYSFGSNQGNSHAHWHVVPLPPGVAKKRMLGVFSFRTSDDDYEQSC